MITGGRQFYQGSREANSSESHSQGTIANTKVGSVAIITLNPTVVTNVAAGFSSLFGIIYDGANIWVTDNMEGHGLSTYRHSLPAPARLLWEFTPTG